MGFLANNENRASLKVRLLFATITAPLTSVFYFGFRYLMDDFVPSIWLVIFHTLFMFLGMFLTSYLFLKKAEKK
ncbi:hypothetical protein [Nonlabens ponticola]|uniref:Uncharacterized protein n=1 Tax=Nonlabens ponticola TaxID=2496866 RepID=A0A3S9MZ37_9FLAO|nr:hypothetical protein [Nonlabens ponticola]AZQ44526.1 hypothetical protein EJ995_09820 [Nonlabens ponticola]